MYSLRAIIIVLCAFLALSSNANAQKSGDPARTPPPASWEPVGSGITGTRVSDLVVYDGKLIACGTFTQAGGIPASNIAAWDGTTWSALGSGVNHGVVGMALYNGELIVTGNFDYAGGNLATGVAAWDGTSWSALGSGIASTTSAIATYNGSLYVARNTGLPPYGVQISYIMRWTGSTWYAATTFYADPTTDQVQINALGVAGGELFAGGLVEFQAIRSYNGTSWSNVGGGPFVVYSFGDYSGNAIAGGYDTLLEEWDGSTTWTTLDNTWAANCGWTFDILGLYGLLVAGGDYSAASCTPHPYLITWDGSSWDKLGNQGPNDRVLALAEYDSRLFAAGEFNKADNKTASLIAQLDVTVPVRKMSLGDVRKLFLNKSE